MQIIAVANQRETVAKLQLQQFKVLYICGNYSSVLAGWTEYSRTLTSAEPFAVFQLMTILEEAPPTP